MIEVLRRPWGEEGGKKAPLRPSAPLLPVNRSIVFACPRHSFIYESDEFFQFHFASCSERGRAFRFDLDHTRLASASGSTSRLPLPQAVSLAPSDDFLCNLTTFVLSSLRDTRKKLRDFPSPPQPPLLLPVTAATKADKNLVAILEQLQELHAFHGAKIRGAISRPIEINFPPSFPTTLRLAIQARSSTCQLLLPNLTFKENVES